MVAKCTQWTTRKNQNLSRDKFFEEGQLPFVRWPGWCAGLLAATALLAPLGVLMCCLLFVYLCGMCEMSRAGSGGARLGRWAVASP